ncbi:hypothetical protein EJ03DRAFT_82143 [Teratosphaeria nubilosa]|uniref:Uncharacterized protein n=1 Tax=Teratosphaeria nubilosa TaxID=161662 RepID=A0A6G1LCI8_9PEZI|nr:hypothetical protein EJ03DRAFT_82143 [Teratosphaeria nubilosa]
MGLKNHRYGIRSVANARSVVVGFMLFGFASVTRNGERMEARRLQPKSLGWKGEVIVLRREVKEIVTDCLSGDSRTNNCESHPPLPLQGC